MTKEPIILINGEALFEAQCINIQCTLERFDSLLRIEGLGDDEHGPSMVKSYRRNIKRPPKNHIPGIIRNRAEPLLSFKRGI